MIFKGAIGELIDFSIGGGWGSEVPRDKHSLVAVIRGTDIPRVAKEDFSTIPFRYESEKKLANRLLSPGDIILETAGGSSAHGQYTGRTLLITQEILDVLGPTICASFCKKLVINRDLVNPTYFYFYMQDLYNSGRVAYYDSQSTGISNFQFETFVNNEIVELPPKETQESIANILFNLQHKTNKNSQISKTLESIARSIFKSWFIDFDPVHAKSRGEKPFGMDDETAALFPDSFEESELGMIPKGWKKSVLGDVLLALESGKRPKGGAQNEGVPSLGAESIRNLGQFDFASTKYVSPQFFQSMNSGKVKPYDVLVYKDGAGAGAHVTMFGEGFPYEDFAINEHVFLLRSDQVPQSYLFFWLNNENYKSLMVELAQKSAQPGLNQKDMKSIPILKPDSLILAAFSELVSPIVEMIMKNSIQSYSLGQIREGLLPRLISGELQLPEESLVS